MKQKVFLLMLLVLGMCSISANAQKKRLRTAKNGYQWYKISKDGKQGAEDMNGNTLIPLSRGYDFIVFHPEENVLGYFGVKRNGKEGACDITGKEIIPCRYDDVIYSNYSDVFKYENSAGEWINMDIKLDKQGKAYGSGSGSKTSGSRTSGSSSNSKTSNDFVEISNKFFSTPKAYRIVAEALANSSSSFKNYKAEDNVFFIVENNRLVIKRRGEKDEVYNILSKGNSIPLASGISNGCIKADKDLYFRAIQNKDGSITIYTYVHNIASGKFVTISFFKLQNK